MNSLAYVIACTSILMGVPAPMIYQPGVRVAPHADLQAFIPVWMQTHTRVMGAYLRNKETILLSVRADEGTLGHEVGHWLLHRAGRDPGALHTEWPNISQDYRQHCL